MLLYKGTCKTVRSKSVIPSHSVLLRVINTDNSLYQIIVADEGGQHVQVLGWALLCRSGVVGSGLPNLVIKRSLRPNDILHLKPSVVKTTSSEKLRQAASP